MFKKWYGDWTCQTTIKSSLKIDFVKLLSKVFGDLFCQNTFESGLEIYFLKPLSKIYETS